MGIIVFPVKDLARRTKSKKEFNSIQQIKVFNKRCEVRSRTFQKLHGTAIEVKPPVETYTHNIIQVTRANQIIVNIIVHHIKYLQYDIRHSSFLKIGVNKAAVLDSIKVHTH